MTSSDPKISPVFMVAVTAIIALGPFTLNIYLPSMPWLPDIFGTNYRTVQLGLTLFLAGLAVSQLVYGPLSDMFGRRPVLFVGLSLFLVGSIVCLFAQSIEVLVLGRIIQALGGGAGMVMGRTIIRDLFDREQTASRLAYVNMGMVVAPMLAPGIGGYLHKWFGWQAIFIAVLIMGALVTSFAWQKLHETMKPAAGEAVSFAGSFASFAHLMRFPLFRGYAFQGAFSVGVFFAFVGGAPYVMVELLEQPSEQYGLYFLGIAAMFMLGNFVAGRMSSKMGVNRMITIGSVFALLAAVAFFLIVLFGWLSPLTLFLPMIGVGLGNGMSAPNSLAGVVSVDPSRAGAAAGLSGCLQMTVGAIMSYMIGLFLADSAWPMAIAMMLGAVLSLASHLMGQRGVNPNDDLKPDRK